MDRIHHDWNVDVSPVPARLVTPIDQWLGQATTFMAAFIARSTT